MIDRTNTNSLKYDFAKECGKPEGILPLWIADMDFPVAKGIEKALEEAVHHGIFGYSDPKERYYKALINWFEKQHAFTINKEWVVKTPGVVYAVATAIKAYTKEGDACLIQSPVYHPFSKCILSNKRRLVKSHLVYQNGSYSIDFDDFEDKIKKEKVKLFILCSPHNPVGRVWTKEELLRMGEICLRHQVLIVSDEIHCDFTYPGYSHTIFQSLNHEVLNQSILCTAPGKSFNLAGLQVSNIMIPNAGLKEQFQKEMERSGYCQLNTLGLVACQAAYETGEEWLYQCKKAIQKNLDEIREFLKLYLPKIKLVEPQGTYLVWLDFKECGFSDEELETFIVHKANLWLDNGARFDASCGQFQRINIACPNATIKKALEQLKKAFEDRANE